MALAALVLLSACNDKGENLSYLTIWGSQENGKTLIDGYGETYNPGAAINYIPAIPEGLDRVRMLMVLEQAGEESPSNIVDYMQLRTVLPISKGTVEPDDADDPILFPTVDLESEGLDDLTPGISVNMNYLDMVIYNLFFTANKKGGQAYAEVTPRLEIDPVVVPGPQNDTINMQLVFDSNMGENETFSDSYLGDGTWCSFDLQSVPGDFSFATLNEQGGGPKTYIIKLGYRSFIHLDNILQGIPYDLDEDELTTRYLTTTWTPEVPYLTEQ